MKELVRNFLHGSEISLFLERDGFGKINRVIKVANTVNGINNIKKEKEGWDWYVQRNSYYKDIVLDYVFKPEKEYARIEIKYIDGIKSDYRKGLTKNVDVIMRIIDHYLSVWLRNEDNLYPIHGDMSVDNVIFQNEKILLCDWEHFAHNVAPWGFDILYLLFETLWFEIRGKTPCKNLLTLLASLIKKINNSGMLTEQQRETPLKTTKDFIQDNLSLWSRQLETFPSKLPVLCFTDKQVDFIDNSISNLH